MSDSLNIDDSFDKFRAPPDFIDKLESALYPDADKYKADLDEKMKRAERQLVKLVEKRNHVLVHRTDDAL